MTVFGVTQETAAATVTGNSQTSVTSVGPDARDSSAYLVVGEKAGAASVSASNIHYAGMVAISLRPLETTPVVAAWITA